MRYGAGNKGIIVKTAVLLMSTLFELGVAHAAPPCPDMADKVSKEFDAEKNMSSGQSKCIALNLLISHLTDLATACAADQKFRDQTYLPLAKAIGDEAPKACPK